MSELGLFGITVAEQDGGAGLDAVSYAVVMEELARGYSSIADPGLRLSEGRLMVDGDPQLRLFHGKPTTQTHMTTPQWHINNDTSTVLT